MKHLTTTLTIAIGLALSSCGGANKPAKTPHTAVDRDDADRDEPSDDKDESSSDEKSSKSSDSSDSDSSDSSSKSESSSGSESSSSASSGSGSYEQEDEKTSGDCQKSSANLAISVDKESIDLDKGRLRAKMDGPICKLTMKITRKDDMPPVEKTFRYNGTERELRWNPVPRDQIEKVEIRVTSQDNGFRAVQIVPWTVKIEHKEVEFDTNRADIRPSETASLRDSLTKIKHVLATVEGKKLGTITLFIAGHTDTVGTDEHNMTLSRNRAQSIANWFKSNGLCVPIAFEGFGETALKKVTADNVDEQANRRVDYILAVEPPTMSKKGGTPAWKWISKGC